MTKWLKDNGGVVPSNRFDYYFKMASIIIRHNKSVVLVSLPLWICFLPVLLASSTFRVPVLLDAIMDALRFAVKIAVLLVALVLIKVAAVPLAF